MRRLKKSKVLTASLLYVKIPTTDRGASHKEYPLAKPFAKTQRKKGCVAEDKAGQSFGLASGNKISDAVAEMRRAISKVFNAAALYKNGVCVNFV